MIHNNNFIGRLTSEMRNSQIKNAYKLNEEEQFYNVKESNIDFNKITIGYLSWKREKIFEQTLNSHKKNGLFDIIPPSNRLIFFQEISDKDIEIAKKFNCRYIGNNDNIGILDAFIKLIENCQTEYFIFCENDWNLIENKNTTIKTLHDSIRLIDNNKANIIKLRHRKTPGHPLNSEKIFNNYLPSLFPYKLESLSWIDEPNKIYNNLFEEFEGNYKWYITTMTHQLWSNNIFLCKLTHIKEIILPILKNKNYDDKYSELENIINNYKSQLRIIKLAASEGLFMHKDNITDNTNNTDNTDNTNNTDNTDNTDNDNNCKIINYKNMHKQEMFNEIENLYKKKI
jgi:hypothetical protein